MQKSSAARQHSISRATREQAKLWQELIEGTNMYSRDELRQYLAGAGFEHISLHLHKNRHWLCLTARKPA